ncbi:lysylphosphatidylglycerol synthase transmembrane domain-containing protein [Algoriphagus sp. CAU 1675]|uniref:lysylphosphatidylglycerol synthase transmembrane domain-containing protein n=1 Tax=Algoriphagus sp. CAU 1675 TaxID=3032597 RepID=UPI0023DCD370|nr:lysylphosphatidylglycerol synthase transmembrane domain-containing protein [Algoriphagus sp. CAU 1675]MDF2156640.1 lysylphosphatidylglycerol synthase transmembrane domain-containing protein [Algoriphagus sp. CAU 1675]
MIHSRIKQTIQITVSLGIAVWIFWFLYKDIAITKLLTQIRSSNWYWIGASLSIALFGYWLRGWRWTLLIRQEEGKKVSSGEAYHAVMVGYLANLLIPRAGEVARCGVLTRTNRVSLGHLVGTVLVERSIDLLFLLATILLAFFVESNLFLELANQLIDLQTLGEKLLSNLPIFIGGILIFAIFLFLLFRKYRDHGIIQKAQHFFKEIYSGFKAIGSLSNPVGFWASSAAIWIIYFLTMFTVSLGIPSTANLSSGEILLVMVMGSIGMVAPVQGGIGTFHALVAFILIQFGISEEDGKIFAAIIHGTQVILVLVAGLTSWLIVIRKPSWIKPGKA